VKAASLTQDLQTVTFGREAVRADRLTEYRNHKFLDEKASRWVTRRLEGPGGQVAIVEAGRAMVWHEPYDRIAAGPGRE
jgi:hypothetical protein